MDWRCPRCRGPLVEEAQELRCSRCAAQYPQVAGIPDFRLPGVSWIDQATDTATARHLTGTMAGCTAEELVRYVSNFDEAVTLTFGEQVWL